VSGISSVNNFGFLWSTQIFFSGQRTKYKELKTQPNKAAQ